jgi:transposase-like protein
MPERRRKFTPEFKDEAVKMVTESSRAVAEVAREIGVNEGTLGNWVNKYRVEHADEEPPLSISDRARLRELEGENRELKMKSEFQRRSGGLLRPGVSVSSRFEFIDGREGELLRSPMMCEWADVSTSGYYEWRDRPTSATAVRRARLAALIDAIFVDSDRTYGHRRLHAQLGRMGERCSPEPLRSIMRELDPLACQPRPVATHDHRRRRPRTDPRPAGPRLHRRRAGHQARRPTSPTCRPGKASPTSPR